MQVSVETRQNALGDCEPCRFRIGRRCFGVTAVLDRWLHPEHAYFKVQASDGTTYILRLDVASGCWEVTLYESGERPAHPVAPEVKRQQ